MSKSGFAKQHLRSYIERIERLEEEKAATTSDIREVYAEAKGDGFNPKIMRMVVRLRKLDSAQLLEQQAILDLYMGALGMGTDVAPEIEARATQMIAAQEAEAAHA